MNWVTSPEYVYFLAFPLLTALALVLFPWFALVKTRSVSANLLDLSGFGIGCVTLASCATAWTVMLTGWGILRHGGERFYVHPIFKAPEDIGFGLIALFALLAAPLIFYAARYSVAQGTCSKREAVAGVFGGLLTGVAIAGGILNVIPTLLNTIRTALGSLCLYLGPGYSDRVTRQLYPEHAVAIIAFVTALALYAVIGLLKLNRKIPSVPSLTYLILFLVLACWGLSALSFFLDLYRIPAFLVIGAWLTLTAQLTNTDHFFHVWRAKASAFPPAPKAGDLLANMTGDSLIVVAANGGGIQSAAWTARVLAGIESMARQRIPKSPGVFTNALRMISSVSGGSVGTMFFVNEFRRDCGGLPAGPEVLNRIVKHAEASSLDQLAWGLFYPDLLKTIIPMPGLLKKDRGRALEAAFEMNDETLGHPLASWREGVLEGWRPATTFNSTISDTGERLLLSTADLTVNTGDARKNFCELFPDEPDAAGLQLSIASAARLSATFPYVTPAARADLGGPGVGQWHAVDGGYYDNYGMSTLVEWLNEALSEPRHKIKRVLVLQVRGLPPDDAGQAGTQRGWFYQLFAPLATMFNVRSCGQLSHNNVEYGLLRDFWGRHEIEVDTVVFQVPGRKVLGDDPPLSWHLTPKQKVAIEMAWKSSEVTESLEKVFAFLSSIQGAKAALHAVG